MRFSSRSLSLFLAPLMVLTGAACEYVSAANKQASAMLIAESSRMPPAPPPTAGVTLLEGIYKKLRNAPQLAMKQPVQIAQATNEQSSKGLYLIRPAEKAKSSDQSQGNLNIAYGSAVNDYRGAANTRAMAMRAPSASYIAKKDAALDKATRRDAKEVDASPAIDTRATVQQFQGVHRLPPATENRLRQSLGGLSKTLSDVNELNQPTDQLQPHVRSYLATGAPTGGSNPSLKARLDQNSGHKTIADEPRIIEYPQGGKGSPAQSAAVLAAVARQLPAAPVPQLPGSTPTAGFGGQLQAANAGMALVPPPPPVTTASSSVAQEEMKPVQPSLFTHIWNMTRGLQPVQSYGDEETAGAAHKEIAMLSPKVVGGIPLVRLGVSASQTEQALGNAVTIKKQNIGSWNVWSVSRLNSRDSMLQIYLRSGVVEGIRVFDPAYLGPEIGVRLGDDLKTMLKQFSQPAFILEEPPVSHQMGKNYVYPISHVSFELARAKDKAHTDPQVVSVLIFDVE